MTLTQIPLKRFSFGCAIQTQIICVNETLTETSCFRCEPNGLIMIMVVYHLNLCHVNCVSNNILLYEVIWLVIDQIFFKLLPLCLLCIWWCVTIFNPLNAHLTQKKTSNENIKNTNSLVRSHTTKSTNILYNRNKPSIYTTERGIKNKPYPRNKLKTKRINLHFNRVLIFSSKSNILYE